MNCLSFISSILRNFEIARESENSYTVTELAKALSSPRSHGVGAKTGIKVHNFWGDPFEIARIEDYFCPFPLACRLKEYWIYGVADLVRFRKCLPVEVVEVKSYEKYGKYERLQVIFYSYIAYEAFLRKSVPSAFLVLGWNGRFFKKKVLVEWSPSIARQLILQAVNRKRIKRKI